MKYIPLCLAFALAACSSSGPSPSSGSSTTWPMPAGGQWASGFGQNPTANLGTTYTISGGQGMHYVYTPAPANLKTASSMTLTFTLSGNATWIIEDPSDTGPPMVDLFIWEAGDNLSCAGTYDNYRVFSGPRVQLQNGTYTLTAPLTQANWHNCYGQAAGLSQAIGGAAYVGYTFGGQDFDGHGVGVASGTATFTLNSFTIQ